MHVLLFPCNKPHHVPQTFFRHCLEHMATTQGRAGQETDHDTTTGSPTSSYSFSQRPRSATSSMNRSVRVDQEIPRNRGQEDDATEAVERGINHLENLVQDLRMASDALSTQRLHRLKDREGMCKRLEEAKNELRRNTEFTERLNQRLQDTELTVKDKDMLCSTLAREVERLRQLLLQHGVNPYHEVNDDFPSLDIAVGISHDQVKRQQYTYQRQNGSQDLPTQSLPPCPVVHGSSYPSIQGSPSASPLYIHTTSNFSSLSEFTSSVVYEANEILSKNESGKQDAPTREREVKRLHEIITTLHQQLQKVLEVNRKWKNDYLQLEAEKNRTIERLQSEVRLLQEEVTKLERQRDDEKKEKRRVSDQLQRSEAERKKTERQLDHIVNEGEERCIHKSTLSFRQQLSASNRQSDRSRSELVVLQEEVDSLRNELQAAKAKINQMNRGIRGLAWEPEEGQFRSNPHPSDWVRQRTGNDLQTSQQYEITPPPAVRPGNDYRGSQSKGEEGLQQEQWRQPAILAEIELPSNVTVDLHSDTE